MGPSRCSQSTGDQPPVAETVDGGLGEERVHRDVADDQKAGHDRDHDPDAPEVLHHEAALLDSLALQGRRRIADRACGANADRRARTARASGGRGGGRRDRSVVWSRPRALRDAWTAFASRSSLPSCHESQRYGNGYPFCFMPFDASVLSVGVVVLFIAVGALAAWLLLLQRSEARLRGRLRKILNDAGTTGLDEVLDTQRKGIEGLSRA